MNNSKKDSLLTRPSSVCLLRRIFWAVLLLTIVLQLVITIKGYFGIDGWVGFGAVYGFLSCVVMVLVAKVLGYLLKRDESYYHLEGESD